MSRIRAVTHEELSAEIDENGPLLVEFWAPWCSQCTAMANVLERLAETLPAEIAMVSVNVEQQLAAAERHGVSSLPTLLFFRDRAVRTRLVGFKRLPLVQAQLKPLL